VPVAHKRARAKRDIVEHYVYLAEHGDIDTAQRFLANAGETFSDLSRNPHMGAPLSWRSPKLAELRKWRVSGFENFLVFYLPRPDGVTIVRVLHAAQDWWSALGIL
jgi:toxin ParE1/3/4